MSKRPFRQSPVRLEIETIIKHREDCEQLRSIVDGTIYDCKGMKIITYTETLEDGKVHHVLKVMEKNVILVRRGAVAVRQLFETGCKTESIYRTPYGELALTTLTKNIQFHWDSTKETGHLVLTYDLSLQGNPSGSYTLNMWIKGVCS